MRKIRGVIDPYTLGFLISLIGTTTAYVVLGGPKADDAIETSTFTEEQTVVSVQEHYYDSDLFD